MYRISQNIYIKLWFRKKFPNEDIDAKVNTKREELLKSRKRESNEVIKKSILKEMIVNYIITRTNITGDFEVKLLPCTGDTPVIDTIVSLNADGVETTKEEQRLDIVFQAKPKGLKPFYIPRRRKTTAAEFHQTARSLRVDAARLNEACDRAHRAAGLAVASVDGFKGSRRLTFDPSKMSIAKFRWMQACHRVVLINFADAVRKRLEGIQWAHYLTVIPHYHLQHYVQAYRLPICEVVYHLSYHLVEH